MGANYETVLLKLVLGVTDRVMIRVLLQQDGATRHRMRETIALFVVFIASRFKGSTLLLVDPSPNVRSICGLCSNSSRSKRWF